MSHQAFTLSHPRARSLALLAVRHAPDGYVVIVRPRRRSLDQNALFHALCGELAGRAWAGKPRSAVEWKVLLVSGHAVATQQGAEVVEGLEGELVNLRESTAGMSTSRMSSLIEYAQAWMAGAEA